MGRSAVKTAPATLQSPYYDSSARPALHALDLEILCAPDQPINHANVFHHLLKQLPGYAKVLGDSILRHNPSARFLVVLCDEKRPDIDYAAVAGEVITAADIEPRWGELSRKYNIVELNTCIKPRVFQFLFEERGIPEAIYFDPDIQVYQPLDFMHLELTSHTILLTPHICTPIGMDGRIPSENTFLKFGIYNLGFIAIADRGDARKFLDWWKGHTYEMGYSDTYKGMFVDQLPINLAPVFFRDVKILLRRGLNMAPWNLHERSLQLENGQFVVENDGPLVFYHFSSLKPAFVNCPATPITAFGWQTGQTW